MADTVFALENLLNASKSQRIDDLVVAVLRATTVWGRLHV
jgi:hypothetical protein